PPRARPHANRPPAPAPLRPGACPRYHAANPGWSLAMILDHLTVSVSNFEVSKAFYGRALEPLGITVIMQFPGVAGFGKERPQFWIAGGATGRQSAHVSFVAANRPEVRSVFSAPLPP